MSYLLADLFGRSIGAHCHPISWQVCTITNDVLAVHIYIHRS
jgi:hypothetical protein